MHSKNRVKNHDQSHPPVHPHLNKNNKTNSSSSSSHRHYKRKKNPNSLKKIIPSTTVKHSNSITIKQKKKNPLYINTALK
jgi:hypothetical protein